MDLNPMKILTQPEVICLMANTVLLHSQQVVPTSGQAGSTPGGGVSQRPVSVGFTGTQQGMTPRQKEELRELLIALNPVAFHHGDCIGADAEAHEIVLSLGIEITIHPPHYSGKRAFCKRAQFVHPTAEYLQRNRDIVDDTSHLIAAPKTAQEELRSGTWATVRYARIVGNNVTILEPLPSTPEATK